MRRSSDGIRMFIEFIIFMAWVAGGIYALSLLCKWEDKTE
jgi:hypothetical protein